MSTQVINTRYEILEAAPGADVPPFLVSKARDREEGRVVGLQVLPAEALGGGPARRQEFQAAVREAQRLDAPGILRVYDQGVSEGGGDLYVVREYVRGITLAERIRRVAPFTLAVAADIAVSIAEALAVAHREGVTHGGLTPAHVLLSPEGQIKVADFAYGAVASPYVDEGGRNPYRAPELGPGIAGTLAGDVYALGAMLYEMLTGASPLVGGVRVTSPRAVNPGVPPALDGLTQKAMHPDPAVRYRSASALLADLQAVRDALRSGKSLAWSPLTEKRVPRLSAAEETAVAPRPEGIGAAPVGGAMATAAKELDEERYGMRERDTRETSAALGIALRILFVIAVLGVIGLSWYATKFLAVPNDVQVPNLVGRTFDDAKRIGQQQHFTVIESDKSDYSDTWPENQIYEQIPLAGHTIKADKEVTVFTSLGPRLLTVPPLVGTMQDAATHALQDGNLPLGSVSQEYSESVPTGVVIRQSPDPNSKVARNTAVNIVVSKGKQPPDAPGDVQANATGPDKVDLSWKGAARAESYTILRSLDGDVKTIARALPDTHFTDTGLAPETTYSYTINAVNAAGPSAPSESALVTTQAKVEVAPPPPPVPVTPPVPPVVTPDTPAPDVVSGDTTPDVPKTAKLRQFTIEFKVPRRPRRTRHIQIEIQDTTGTNLVYDEYHEPGEDVSAPVQGIGHKVTFRIFMDGSNGMSLVKQQTF